MTHYYFIEGKSKAGPISLDLLFNYPIFKETLVWREGFSDWKEAGDVPELIDIIKEPPSPDLKPQSPPPIHIHQNSSINDEASYRNKYDYSEIEDIAGVDYKIAMGITGVLLAVNILFLDIALSSIGMIGITGLAVASWWFFKQYFDSQKDTVTGKFVMVIMGAHILFGLSYLYVGTMPWVDVLMRCRIWDLIAALFGTATGCVGEFMAHIGFIMFLISVAAFTNFFAGFRILMVNQRYPFPLKRIAVSSMLLLPFLFFNYFSEGFLGEESSIITRAILSLPYIFLFHHFYRAETEDKTP